LTLHRSLNLFTLGDILPEDLILRSVAHVPNLTFDVSKDGLEELVLLLDDNLVVKNLLHGLMVSYFGKHSKSLQLLRILLVV
jgi:hypothetical protein